MNIRKAERLAAMAVLTAAAAVAGAGYRLAKKHTALLMKKAAATFKDENLEAAAKHAEADAADAVKTAESSTQAMDEREE